MTDDDLGRSRVARQPSAAAQAGREAAALVGELNRQLGLWQASSVKLQTMAERAKSAGRAGSDVASEIRTLFAAVTAEARRFDARLAAQPPEVAEHGRIRDTRRSFEMISGRLRQSLRLLGEEAGEE
jgi:hypothetical protein